MPTEHGGTVASNGGGSDYPSRTGNGSGRGYGTGSGGGGDGSFYFGDSTYHRLDERLRAIEGQMMHVHANIPNLATKADVEKRPFAN